MEKASEDKRKKNAFRRINWGYIGFFIILLLIFLFKKKLFFLALFIFLNWFILYMKLGLGIDSPVEVITFGTFMAGYVYGPAEGLIISGSSLIAISVTGRIKFDKIVINFILFIIAFVAQYLRFMNVALAGILILLLRYILDFSFNLLVLQDSAYVRKIPDRLINFLFWFLFYTSFGSAIADLMKV